MSEELKPCSGGDPAACASALHEFYRLVETSAEEGNHTIPITFDVGDAGFCRGGCGLWRVTTIGGPGGEVVLHIYEGDEMVGWADTGWVN
jgi:hypothetical protein